MFLCTLIEQQGLVEIQSVTAVHPTVSTPTLTTSLKTPPVTKTGQPPKKTSQISKRNLKKTTSTDAKDETGSERSVTVGILAKNKPSNHNFLSSQPMSHSSFSRKDDVSNNGQVTSVSDNTLFADVIPLATDPSHLSPITAPAVNVSLQSQGEIQADPSVFNDPSAKTQADDDEKTTHSLPNDQGVVAAAFRAIIKGEEYSEVADVTKRMLLVSRGRKSLVLGNHIIVTFAEAGIVAGTGKSYHITKLTYFQYSATNGLLFNICATSA